MNYLATFGWLYAAASLGFIFGFFVCALLAINRDYWRDKRDMTPDEIEDLKQAERTWGQKW